MKADMLALKDQMASMMEAMLGMKRLIESNATTATTNNPPKTQVKCLTSEEMAYKHERGLYYNCDEK